MNVEKFRKEHPSIDKIWDLEDLNGLLLEHIHKTQIDKQKNRINNIKDYCNHCCNISYNYINKNGEIK